MSGSGEAARRQSSNEIESEILREIDSIHARLKTKGIECRTYTKQSIEFLQSLEDDKKAQILQSLKEWSSILSVASDSGVHTLRDEIRMVESVISRRSLTLKGCDWDMSDDNLVIEVYNQDGVQVYRSQSFFGTCSYAILDISAREWFALWNRPYQVIQQMTKIVSEVLHGQLKTTVVDIPRHLILEIYNESKVEPFHPKAIAVEFKNIYPLYSPDDRIAGFVVTSTAEVVSEGDDFSKLDCI